METRRKKQTEKLIYYILQDEAANKFEKWKFCSFWSVEASDFKNVIWNKIHWVDFEGAEV